MKNLHKYFIIKNVDGYKFVKTDGILKCNFNFVKISIFL